MRNQASSIPSALFSLCFFVTCFGTMARFG
jgi:hypothetical protein